MSNRTAKFTLAIFASVVAGVALATVSQAAPAADECLSAPNKQSPDGSHWYYRIDRSTKRHCWYLGDLRDRAAQDIRPKLKPQRNLSSAELESTSHLAVADAHAELPAQTRVEEPYRNEALRAALQRAPALLTQGSAATSRLPGQSIDIAAAGPATDEASSATEAPSASQDNQPILATAQLATADVAPDNSAYSKMLGDTKSPAYSMQMRFAALMGALLLACAIASLVFRLTSRRFPRLAKVRQPRRVNWESANVNRRNITAFPAAKARSARRARELRDNKEPDDRMTEFLAQLRRPT